MNTDTPLYHVPDLNGDGLRVGIVRARFNEDIGLAELETCLEELQTLGVAAQDIMVITVPGALELGVTLAQMAQALEFDALIALGAVVRGETYHFEVVSNESAAALTRVALEHSLPVANGVLTADTEEQAMARAAQKGRDCAQAAVEMANLLYALMPEDDAADNDDPDDDMDDDRVR